MSDYMKINDAKQLFIDSMGNGFPQFMKKAMVEKLFEKVSSADVVEVVRCKDCKHYTGLGECKLIGECAGTEGFCSWGVHK